MKQITEREAFLSALGGEVNISKYLLPYAFFFFSNVRKDVICIELFKKNFCLFLLTEICDKSDVSASGKTVTLEL